MKYLSLILLGLAKAIFAVATPHHSLAPREGNQQDATSPHLEARAASNRIEFDTFVRIRDDEWPGGDDYFNRDQAPRSLLIGNEYGYRRDDYFEARAGGEIRIEVSTVFYLIGDGSIYVQYTIDMYEGISEGTQDHDGRTQGSFIVAPNRSFQQSYRVKNTAEDDSDTGTVTFYIANARV